MRVIAAATTCLLLLGLAAAPARADEAASIYDPGTVNVIEMTLPQAAIEGLEDEPFEYQGGGTVTFTPTDGTPPAGGQGTPTHTFENVEIRLKGKPLGSFEDLDGKAAFKLKFKKAEPFFGLRKLTLNNMTQDPSMIHETLAYTAFRAAGVPASRSGYSYVWLNGKNYGLHLNLESLDAVSLPKIFGAPFDDEVQHLYEANEYGADFYPGKESRFEIDEGGDDTADLTALIAAVEAAAPTGAIPPSLAAAVDLEEMTRMWAVEKYIGHWDGYAGHGIAGLEGFNEFRPNNYYLYSEPSGRFLMLPWGTDQAWDVGDTGGVPMAFDGQDGRLFDLCREDEECAGMFSAAVAHALAQVGGLDLDAQAQATAAMLGPWQALEAAPRKPFSGGEIAAAVAATREFIADRPAEAEAWLEQHPPPAEPKVIIGPGLVVTETLGETIPAPRGSAANLGPVEFPRSGPTLRVGRGTLVGGVLRTRIELGVGGTVVQTGSVRRGDGNPRICRDRAEATGPGSLTLRCDLPEWVRQRLRQQRVWVTLALRLSGPDGDAEVTRRLGLPRQ